MEINKREQEQRDWKGYSSAERPVVVTYYHVQDDHEVHRLISINDYAIWDLFGDQATFELHLAARYRSVELVGSGKVIVKPADQTAILAEGAQEIKRRIEEVRAKHPGIRWEPWMPERLDQQKLDKTVPPTTVPDDDPSSPSESRENPTNQLLAAISHAIFDCIAPVVTGTLKQGGPAVGTNRRRLHVVATNAAGDRTPAGIQAGGSGSGGCSCVISRWRAGTDYRACRCTNPRFPLGGQPRGFDLAVC